ncbi:serine/threonine-protein kinase [Yoonia sp.]|uniref:serine/threonine-protein kinase n=1 Tax=Yoonia sp. TaxID=2212373 RepID=UPI002FD9D4E9
MANAQPKENVEEKENFVDELKPGTKLMHGQYTIESFLNAGGFGITYLARDSLDRKVVIKECFPGAFCRRSRAVVQARSRAHQNELKSIVRLFVQEARSLAKLDHPNIVGVHQVFEDNDTAYMALDFVRGRDMLDIIEDANTSLTPAQIRNILKELLGAVGFIHDQGILHRDISPDNILINKDFHPILIDFGAAREEATKQSRVLSALRVVKDGYSPQEFYIAGSDQSPSSDLYALAASFHHLITGEVPPNSQARLAAIASGETDPYKAIVGRFPDYDDNFLAAIDKALAVLPKDRLKSAHEWLNMMEGVGGNVTALNVGPATAAGGSGAATRTAAAGKSNMPLLLGSAAVVALLVGVGVMTMSGSEQPAADLSAPAAAVEAPAVAVETAPVAQDTATVTETPAAEETAVATQDAATATEEAPAAAEEPAVTEETAVAPVVLETAPPLETAPVDTPAVESALETAIATEAAPEATATPEIASDPVTTDAPETTAVVAAPAITDTATPDIRPQVRPDAVALAAVPDVAPLPEPAETPAIVTESPAAATLPELAATTPTADAATGDVTLPVSPEQVASVSDGLPVDILTVTPGNEVVVVAPAAGEPDLLTTEWTVRLPFTPVSEGSNIVGGVAAIAPVWVQPGIEIASVNGTPVQSIDAIPDALRSLTPEASLSASLPVLFGIADEATGTSVAQAWVLPVVQNTTLSDGTAFETYFSGSGWRTVVTDLSATTAGGLQIGDVVTSYIATSEPVDDRTSIVDIFTREIAAGIEQFTFAVQRDGSLWIATYTYDGTE